MTRQAWYLHCTPDQVAEDAIVVGDRGRVLLARELLDDAVMMNEDRGLTTVTGSYRGHRVTVSAFGMGAPIAAVVVDELAYIGVKRVVRLGTVMTAGATELGDFALAHGAIRGDGTSRDYLPIEVPAIPSFALTQQLHAAGAAAGHTVRTGLFDTRDGFYTHMMERDRSDHHDAVNRERRALNVIGTDMETSAIFIVGTARGIETASLCLASVSGEDFSKLAGEERTAAERDLLVAGLEGLRRPAAA